MSLTVAQGRAAIAHLRDKLELTNRDMARVFQDHVQPDKFVDFMTGDDQAITPEQSEYIGNELAHYVPAEDADRERVKRAGFTPEPGFREILGFTKEK